MTLHSPERVMYFGTISGFAVVLTESSLIVILLASSKNLMKMHSIILALEIFQTFSIDQNTCEKLFRF